MGETAEWGVEGDAAAFLLVDGQLDGFSAHVLQHRPGVNMQHQQQQRLQPISTMQQQEGPRIASPAKLTCKEDALSPYPVAPISSPHAEMAMEMMSQEDLVPDMGQSHATYEQKDEHASSTQQQDLQHARQQQAPQGMQQQVEVQEMLSQDAHSRANSMKQDKRHEAQQVEQQHAAPTAKKVVVIKRKPANKYQHLLTSAGTAMTDTQAPATVSAQATGGVARSAALEDGVEDAEDGVPEHVAASGLASGLARNSGLAAMQVPNLRRPRLMGKQAGFKALDLMASNAAGVQEGGRRAVEEDVIQIHSSDDEGGCREGVAGIADEDLAGTQNTYAATQPALKAVVIKRRRTASQPWATGAEATLGGGGGFEHGGEDGSTSGDDFNEEDISHVAGATHGAQDAAGRVQSNQQGASAGRVAHRSSQGGRRSAGRADHSNAVGRPWVYMPDVAGSVLQRFDPQSIMKAMEADKKIRCRPVHNASLLLHKLPAAPNIAKLLQQAQRAVAAQHTSGSTQPVGSTSNTGCAAALEAAQKLMAMALEGDEYEQLRSKLPFWPPPPPSPLPAGPVSPFPSPLPCPQLLPAGPSSAQPSAGLQHAAAMHTHQDHVGPYSTAQAAQTHGLQARTLGCTPPASHAAVTANQCDVDEDMDDAFWEQVDAAVAAATAAKASPATTLDELGQRTMRAAPSVLVAATSGRPNHCHTERMAHQPSVAVTSVWDELMEEVGSEAAKRLSAASARKHTSNSWQGPEGLRATANLRHDSSTFPTDRMPAQVQQHHNQQGYRTVHQYSHQCSHRYPYQHSHERAHQGMVSVNAHWPAADDSQLLQPAPQQQQQQDEHGCMRVFEDVLMEFDPGQSNAAGTYGNEYDGTMGNVSDVPGDRRRFDGAPDQGVRNRPSQNWQLAQQQKQKQHTKKNVRWADESDGGCVHTTTTTTTTRQEQQQQQQHVFTLDEAMEVTWSSDGEEDDMQQERGDHVKVAAPLAGSAGTVKTASTGFANPAQSSHPDADINTAPTLTSHVSPTATAVVAAASLLTDTSQQPAVPFTTAPDRGCSQGTSAAEQEQADETQQAVSRKVVNWGLLESLPGCDILFDLNDDADEAQVLAAAEQAVEKLTGQQLAAAAAAMQLTGGHVGLGSGCGGMDMMEWEEYEDDPLVEAACTLNTVSELGHCLTQQIPGVAPHGQMGVATSHMHIQQDEDSDEQACKRARLQAAIPFVPAAAPHTAAADTMPAQEHPQQQQQVHATVTAPLVGGGLLQANQAARAFGSDKAAAVGQEQAGHQAKRVTAPSVRERLQQRLAQEILRLHRRSKVDLATLKSFLATTLNRHMAAGIATTGSTEQCTTTASANKAPSAATGQQVSAGSAGSITVHWSEIVSMAMQHRTSLFGELEVTPHRLFLALLSLATQNNTAIMQATDTVNNGQKHAAVGKGDALSQTKLWLPGVTLQLHTPTKAPGNLACLQTESTANQGICITLVPV